MKTLSVFVLGLVTLLAGCGGSGAKSSPDPAREVALRQAALMLRFKASDAPGFLQFVAEGYNDAYGANKPALSALITADFQAFDTLALALTSERFLVSNSGNSVQVEAVYRITDREKATNDTAKELPFEEKAEGSCQYRQVDRWLPIHEWNVNQVWWEIMRAGTRHHWAYDEGMPRLSCVFCVFAPKSALMTAGRLNPELLDQYVQVELEIGHRFKQDMSIQSIQDALRQGEGVGQVERWAA